MCTSEAKPEIFDCSVSVWFYTTPLRHCVFVFFPKSEIFMFVYNGIFLRNSFFKKSKCLKCRTLNQMTFASRSENRTSFGLIWNAIVFSNFTYHSEVSHVKCATKSMACVAFGFGVLLASHHRRRRCHFQHFFLQKKTWTFKSEFDRDCIAPVKIGEENTVRLPHNRRKYCKWIGFFPNRCAVTHVHQMRTYAV